MRKTTAQLKDEVYSELVRLSAAWVVKHADPRKGVGGLEKTILKLSLDIRQAVANSLLSAMDEIHDLSEDELRIIAEQED